MAQRTGRLTCPRCGTNNFDTVTACWKCGAPIGAAASGASMTSPQSPMMPNPMPPMMPGIERVPMPTPDYRPVGSVSGFGVMPSVTGDPAVARRAAILLALTIPWLGLPVGWIFMMIEDGRKQAVGRVCVLWSVIGLILQLVLMAFATQAMGSLLMRFLLPAMDAASRSRGGGGLGGLGGGGTP